MNVVTDTSVRLMEFSAYVETACEQTRVSLNTRAVGGQFAAGQCDDRWPTQLGTGHRRAPAPVTDVIVDTAQRLVVLQSSTEQHSQSSYNNNNNTNTNDNVYGAVIVTQSLREFTRFIWPADQRQTAADPQTRPTDLGCESACRLLYGLHTSSLFYYYSARKLILILLSHGGWKAESIGTHHAA